MDPFHVQHRIDSVSGALIRANEDCHIEEIANKTKFFYLIEGSVSIISGDSVWPARVGKALKIDPGVHFRISAGGNSVFLLHDEAPDTVRDAQKDCAPLVMYNHP